MSNESEKSLEELRAAIEAETAESATEQEPTEEGKSQEQEASDNTEETSKEASDKDTQSEGTQEQEKWVVPGRFRTQEDLLNSYRELESFSGRQSSEIQKLRGAITEPARRGETPDQKEARLRKFAERIKEDPIDAIKDIIREETGSIRTEVKASEFQKAYIERKKNTEFAELEPTMVALANSFGDMIIANDMQNDPRLLDILFYAAKGLKSQETAAKAKAEGVKKGEEIHRKKQKAKVEGASGTKKTSKIDISKLSAKEMKEKLLKGEIDPTE